MTVLSEHDLLAGIKSRDRMVLGYIYDEYYAMIRDLVCKNSGTVEDARDVFQEALIVIYEQTYRTDLKLRSSFKTYFYAICRNKWLMQLRKQKSGPRPVLDSIEFDQAEADKEQQHWLHHERYKLMREHFKRLGEDCREVLTMFLQGFSLKDIADKMGYTDKYAKKRKFMCQKKLIESIESDGMYHELLNV